MKVAIATVQRRFLPHGLWWNLSTLSSLAYSTDGESRVLGGKHQPSGGFFFFFFNRPFLLAELRLHGSMELALLLPRAPRTESA